MKEEEYKKEYEDNKQRFQEEEYDKEQERRQRITDEDYYNEGERHNFGVNYYKPKWR